MLKVISNLKFVNGILNPDYTTACMCWMQALQFQQSNQNDSDIKENTSLLRSVVQSEHMSLHFTPLPPLSRFPRVRQGYLFLLHGVKKC